MVKNIITPKLTNKQVKKAPIKPTTLYVEPVTTTEIIKAKLPYLLACLPGCLLLAGLIYLNTGTRIRIAEMEEKYNTTCHWVEYVQGVECGDTVVSYTTTKGEYIVF